MSAGTWSLDWFAARDMARAGRAVRRVAWERGRWLLPAPGIWWLRLPDLTWRVVTAADFTAADFRARDWTPENYAADVCGSLPAYNSEMPLPERGWGDGKQMHPRPIPNFPEVIAP